MKQDFADAVVVISSCESEENSAFGTGFIIDVDQNYAYVLTCAHVFEDTRTHDQVLVNGQPASLVVTGQDQGIDLAVIRVASLKHKPPIVLKNVGHQDRVFKVLGYYGYDTDDRIARRELSGSLGKKFEVSANDNQALIDVWDLTIQDQDRLEEGYSGSPVVDVETGCALGVVSHRLKQGQGGHAISIQGLLQVWPGAVSLLEKRANRARASLPSISPKVTQIYQRLPRRAVSISVIVTLATVVLRFLGAFEFLELRAYDHVLTSRPAEPVSDRIIIIEADRDDVEDQARNDETRNLTDDISDEALEETIAKLNEYGARIIGVDLYLLQPESAWPEDVLQAFKAAPNLYGVCEQPYGEKGSIASPEESIIAPANIGFSNLTPDPDQVLRRHLVKYQLTDEQADSDCRAELAWNIAIAFRYLELEYSTSLKYESLLTSDSERNLQVKETLIRRINSFEYGGYQDLRPEGFELMLNYREPQDQDLRKAFPHFSMEALRQGELTSEVFKDKIVLIGLTADSYAMDKFLTPYQQQETVFGVTLHAHMIDQIISAVLDDRSLIWVWSNWAESGWIGFWGVAGGLLAYYCDRWRWRIGLLGAGLGSIYLACIVTMMLIAGWIPMIPALFSFALSNGVVIYTQGSLRESAP